MKPGIEDPWKQSSLAYEDHTLSGQSLHISCLITWKWRPPVIEDHMFLVPKVVFVSRFHCSTQLCYKWTINGHLQTMSWWTLEIATHNIWAIMSKITTNCIASGVSLGQNFDEIQSHQWAILMRFLPPANVVCACDSNGALTRKEYIGLCSEQPLEKAAVLLLAVS